MAQNPKEGRPRPQVMLAPGQRAGASRPAYAPPPTAPAAAAVNQPPRGEAGASSAANQPHVNPQARAATARPAGPRRAQLFLTRIDPWSVMKSAFMLSVAIALVMMVAVAVLWWTLASAGVFDALTKTANDVAGNSNFDVGGVFGFDKVMGATLVLAAVEIVLVSAFVTLFGYLYNLMVHITGGLELTLSEED